MSFECNLCRCRFSNALLLLEHALIHDKVKVNTWPVWCSACMRTFSSNAVLQTHNCMANRIKIKTETEKDPNAVRNMCEHCKMTFRTDTALYFHLVDHVLSHPLACHACLQLLPCFEELEKHLLNHIENG